MRPRWGPPLALLGGLAVSLTLSLVAPPWPPVRLSLELLRGAPASLPPVPRGASVTQTLALPAGATRVSVPLEPSRRLVSVRTALPEGAGTSQGLSGFVVSSGAWEGRWGVQRTLAAGATTGPADWQGPGAYVVKPGDTLIVQALSGAFDGRGTVHVTLKMEDP